MFTAAISSYYMSNFHTLFFFPRQHLSFCIDYILRHFYSFFIPHCSSDTNSKQSRHSFSKIPNPWMCKSYNFFMYSSTISYSIKKKFYRSLAHSLKVWSSIPWICRKHASLRSLKSKKGPIINTTENKCHWNDCMMYFLVKIAPINYSRRNFTTQ